MFLFATGSMGNAGVAFSTPVVAGIYQRSRVMVGMLVGVVDNMVGTPAGLFCACLDAKSRKLQWRNWVMWPLYPRCYSQAISSALRHSKAEVVTACRTLERLANHVAVTDVNS